MAERQAQKQQHRSEQSILSAHLNTILQSVKAQQVFSCIFAPYGLPTMPCHLLDAQVAAVIAYCGAQMCLRECIPLAQLSDRSNIAHHPLLRHVHRRTMMRCEKLPMPHMQHSCGTKLRPKRRGGKQRRCRLACKCCRRYLS